MKIVRKFVRMVDFTEDNSNDVYRRLDVTWSSETYWSGYYITRNGIVEVYGSDQHTLLSVYRDGKTITRRWQKNWPIRTIARLANKFAAEMAA